MHMFHTSARGFAAPSRWHDIPSRAAPKTPPIALNVYSLIIRHECIIDINSPKFITYPLHNIVKITRPHKQHEWKFYHSHTLPRTQWCQNKPLLRRQAHSTGQRFGGLHQQRAHRYADTFLFAPCRVEVLLLSDVAVVWSVWAWGGNSGASKTQRGGSSV